MSDQRIPRRDDAVDRVRTIYWFQYLGKCIGSLRPRDVQREIFPMPTTDALGNVIKNNKFLGYSRGDHVPRASLVQHAAVQYPESAYVLNHVIWNILRERDLAEKYANAWAGQLSPDIQKSLVQPLCQIQENTRAYQMLVRRFCLDSLAALTILFRLNLETGQTVQAWLYACGIFRTLVLMEPQFITPELGTLVFRLFDQRVFSLVTSFWGARFDLDAYDYPLSSRRLREAARNISDWDETQGMQMNGISIRAPLRRDDLARLTELIDIPFSPARK